MTSSLLYSKSDCSESSATTSNSPKVILLLCPSLITTSLYRGPGREGRNKRSPSLPLAKVKVILQQKVREIFQEKIKQVLQQKLKELL